MLTLVLVSYASWAIYQRSSMIETLDADHVRLARAKGLSRRRVLLRHVLRNALIPVTTVIALDFAAVLGGAILTEIVFGWQGLGQWYVTGVTDLDVNVMLAYLLDHGYVRDPLQPDRRHPLRRARSEDPLWLIRSTEENFVPDARGRRHDRGGHAHLGRRGCRGGPSAARTPTGSHGEARGQFRIVLGRFLHQRLAVSASACSLLLGVASVIVGHFWQYSYTTITNNLNYPPSWNNPFGTNSIGNDMFAQVMAGVEKDIEIALDRGRHRDAHRRDGRRHRRVLPGLGGLAPHALRRPRAGVAGPGRLDPAVEQAGQAVEQLARPGPHHRPALVDLRGPAGAGRLPVAAGTRLRRGVAGARRDQPSHHRQAHAAQRHRARSS